MPKKQSKKQDIVKKAVPFVAGGIVLATVAVGAYLYSNNAGNKLSSNENPNAETTESTETQKQAQTKSENVDPSTITTTTPVTTTNPTTVLGDMSLSITIDDPSTRTTASASLYGPAGTYGVEKLVNGSWSIIADKFTYRGSGGYTFDTMKSSESEVHYRIFALNGDTRSAVSGDTVVKWSLVNENGIYTIPVAR